MGITGVPFGRTEVSIPFVSRFFRDLSHRHGPLGPRVQGMPEKSVFMISVGHVSNKKLKNF